jgi:hypothetical protein
MLIHTAVKVKHECTVDDPHSGRGGTHSHKRFLFAAAPEPPHRKSDIFPRLPQKFSGAGFFLLLKLYTPRSSLATSFFSFSNLFEFVINLPHSPLISGYIFV